MSMERSRGRAGGADEKLCKNVVTSENIREHLLTSWGRSCELSFLNWSRNPVRTLKLINECCSSSTILKLSQSRTHFNVVNFVQFIPVHMCVCALARCTSSWRKLLTTDRSLRRNATSVRHAVTVFSDCPLQVTTVSPRKPAQVYTLFLRFNGHFPTWTWLAVLLVRRMMEVVAMTGAIRRAKLQSNYHNQQTNTQLFTGQMPFLLPNQQFWSTEGTSGNFLHGHGIMTSMLWIRMLF